MNLGHYEGDTDYFPLRFKPSKNPFSAIGPTQKRLGYIDPTSYGEPIDYILTWCQSSPFRALPWLVKNYELVHRQGRSRLYERGRSK
jgi:hypothetical protein